MDVHAARDKGLELEELKKQVEQRAETEKQNVRA